MASDEHDAGEHPEPRDLVQQRLAIALDSAGIGSWELDLASGEFRGDARLLELFGFPADSRETRLTSFARLLPREHRARVGDNLERSVAEGADYAEEYPVVQPDGSWRWVAAHGRPLYGPDGVLQRIVGSAYDTTRQHDAAAQVRATSELLTLIASASDVLAGSLEPVDVVRNFSRLVVPTLADWSIVTLVEGDVLRDVEWWHRDPARHEVMDRFAQHRLEGRHEAAGSLLAFSSRQPFLINDGRPGVRAAHAALAAPRSRRSRSSAWGRWGCSRCRPRAARWSA